MLFKPRGYVTTLKDEKNRRCVSELVKDLGVRLYPVGRLDMYSEGLLIMTDDGDFANRLMHPSSETSKTYHAWISGKCSETALKVLRSPLIIDGRKMCEGAGVKLTKLKRVSEGTLSIGDLKPGQWRHLTEAELQDLQL